MNGQEFELPEFVLLPFEQVKNLIQPQTPEKIYPLTDEQLVSAVDDIRTELFEKPQNLIDKNYFR